MDRLGNRFALKRLGSSGRGGDQSKVIGVLCLSRERSHPSFKKIQGPFSRQIVKQQIVETPSSSNSIAPHSSSIRHHNARQSIKCNELRVGLRHRRLNRENSAENGGMSIFINLMTTMASSVDFLLVSQIFAIQTMVRCPARS